MFLELQRHGYHHPTTDLSPGKCVCIGCLSRKVLESRALFFTNSVHILSDLQIDHCTGSQPWSKSRRQPTAAPSTFTMKPWMHSSSKPTHPIPSHPSSVPSNLLVPRSNIPSTEQISTQAPTIQPKSGNPSLFATSCVAPSITSVQSQEPSLNMTSNSSPSAPPSSSPPPTSSTTDDGTVLKFRSQ